MILTNEAPPYRIFKKIKSEKAKTNFHRLDSIFLKGCRKYYVTASA